MECNPFFTLGNMVHMKREKQGDKMGNIFPTRSILAGMASYGLTHREWPVTRPSG